jgi:hypothetical protein
LALIINCMTHPLVPGIRLLLQPVLPNSACMYIYMSALAIAIAIGYHSHMHAGYVCRR